MARVRLRVSRGGAVSARSLPAGHQTMGLRQATSGSTWLMALTELQSRAGCSCYEMEITRIARGVFPDAVAPPHGQTEISANSDV